MCKFSIVTNTLQLKQQSDIMAVFQAMFLIDTLTLFFVSLQVPERKLEWVWSRDEEDDSHANPHPGQRPVSTKQNPVEAMQEREVEEKRYVTLIS